MYYKKMKKATVKKHSKQVNMACKAYYSISELWDKASSHIHSWKSNLHNHTSDRECTKVSDAKPFTQQAIPSVKEGSRVLYFLDCRTCKQDQPYITDAGVLNVKAKIEHPNYETATIDYTLEIIPGKTTLTSATAKKQYDGKLLTNKTVVVSAEGFVSKEGATYKVTGTITDVGSIKNTFTYTLYKGTKKENYQITNV